MTRAEFLRSGQLPQQELAQLLCAAIGVDRAQLYIEPRLEVPAMAARRLKSQVARRQEDWPIQYLLGQAWFWSRPLVVGPGVLVPRPETEIVVQEMLARAPVGGRVADIGTGSGAIALAVGIERSDLRIVAVERSRRALRYARQNLAGIADVLEGDLFAPLREPQDVIASNPPYVRERDYAMLPPDVRHEPRGALVGGADGLTVVRRLVRGAPGRLAKGGWLILEVGAGQEEEVLSLLERGGFTERFVQEDLAGIPRVVGGKLA
ncbi:MAG: peptide chain release factor N(5)-glutamine methyltransferase [Thermaerobacter sp.]|nr:peptide chain release factor N(5)-glutamine methyltransferase [Thermaerobacter sp.]